MRRWALALGLAWIVAAACYQRLPSADLWWLLAEGRQLLETGQIPGRDPFSWTCPGQPWHNDQWLAGAIFYFFYQWGGLSALHLFKAALLSLSWLLALDTGRRQSGSPGSLAPALLLALAASSAAYFFDVRAYLWTYLGLTLLWRWIQLEERPPLLRLGLLFVAWANLHGGVSSGLLLLLLSALSAPTRAVRNHYLKALALAGLSCGLNPSGWWLLLHPVRLLGSPWSRYLNEWQPAWRRPQLFYQHAGHLLVWLAFWLVRPRDRYDGPLAGFALFSLTGWRHIPLFALLALPRACVKLSGWCGPRWGALGLAAGLLWAGAKPLRLADPDQSLENQLFPRWATRFLSANGLGQRLFHPYGLGGYLCWTLPPGAVCIDGRALQVYPFEVYRDYIEASLDPTRFQDYCRRHQVKLVMLFADPAVREAGVRLIQGHPEWREVYRDDLVVIATRDPGLRPQPVDTPYSLTRRALEMSNPAYLGQALILQADYLPALYYRSLFLLSQSGRPQELEAFLREHPDYAEGNYWLAYHYRRVDPARARRLLERQLQRTPEFAPARQLERELPAR